MDYESVSQFEGMFVKLIFTDNFLLDGTIKKVYKSSAGPGTILFESKQGKSLIELSYLKSIVEKTKDHTDSHKRMYEKYYGMG